MYRSTITVADLQQIGIDATDLTAGGTDNRDRLKAPPGVVTHTPSRTFSANARRDFFHRFGRTPTASELDAHAAGRFDRAAYQPNILIGTTARAFILDSDHQRAQHSGEIGAGCPGGRVYASRAWMDWAKPMGGDWKRHGRDPARVYDFWIAAFPGADTPAEVFPWGVLPNDALGIDLMPDPDTGAYSPEQRRVWVGIVRAWSQLHGFNVSTRTTTTHTYAAPCERGTLVRGSEIIGVHWDPDIKMWPHLQVLAGMGAT